MNIETLVTSNKYILVGLTVLITYLWWYQRNLTYKRFMRLHRLKKVIFPLLNKVTNEKGTLRTILPNRLFKTRYLGTLLRKLDRLHGRPLVRTKQENSSEHILTVDKTPKRVAMALMGRGFKPHLLATLKQREDQYSHSQFVYTHGEKQTEVYLFGNDDGSTSVFAHYETSVLNPEGHLTDEQTVGDPTGIVTSTLGKD